MHRIIELHGRLSRTDRRPANPGVYSLVFQLHVQKDNDEPAWSETIREVTVMPGGFYRVVLGGKSPLGADLFGDDPRWISVRVLRGSRVSPEHGARIPVMGLSVRMADAVANLQTQVRQLEGNGAAGDGRRGTTRLRELFSALVTRVDSIEGSEGLSGLLTVLEQMGLRLDEIDGSQGRLDRVELELTDILDPDGDIADLNQRMDLLEGRAPELINALRSRHRNEEAISLPELRDQVHSLDRRVQLLSDVLDELKILLLSASGSGGREDSGAVLRTGDTMNGGLTIKRGGIEIVSGGLRSRSAQLTTLEVAKQVRSPKVITEAVELRGDLTVDNTHRAVQVRLLEGRRGSVRQDGPLHLNTRGGAQVIVGNAAEQEGMHVHGSVQADGVTTEGGGLAQWFAAKGRMDSGDLVKIASNGKVAVSKKSCEPSIVGVVNDAAGITQGIKPRESRVSVAVAGVVQCKVEADRHPVAPGTSLVASSAQGHARARTNDDPTDAVIIGTALGTLERGRSRIPVLLGRR